MRAIPTNLNPLIELLALYLERRVDHFTMQCSGGNYVHGPYVQALQEHDNMVLIEVTSNRFLEPKLTKESQQKLQFLGWNQYVPDYMPNYARLINQQEKSPMEIAEMMVKALYFAYGVDITYEFEIGPKLEGAKELMNRLGFERGA
jgi:hypothetical protein